MKLPYALEKLIVDTAANIRITLKGILTYNLTNVNNKSLTVYSI